MNCLVPCADVLDDGFNLIKGHQFTRSFLASSLLCQSYLVANHFNQAGHSIHNICVKGLGLNNTNDRKDMESYLIDKMSTRKPAGMNERLY